MCICRFSIAIIIFLHLGFTIFGYPFDDIALNCGSSGNSTALDCREWIGDVGSKSSSSPHHPKGKSTISRALNQYPSADHVPYVTARISRSQFTYTFDVRPGQKFIRLHFYPFSYVGFDVSKSLFSVNAGPYTLLSNFSASLIADSLGVKYFAKEYLVNVDDNQALSITFSPSASTSSEKVYAFINGIEIVSMPTGVYYSLKGDLGVPVVGEDYRFYIANRTALETVYRLNVGGRSILPVEDLGMYRLWSEDRNYLLESGSVSVRTNTLIDYRNIRTYVAPPRVYQTSWSVGGPNLTWKLPLNLGFRYLVRLHFYERESENSESGQSDFVIFFNNKIAEIDEDVIDPSRQDVFSVYMDYLLMMDGDRMEGKRDLIIALCRKPKHESGTRQNSALLNGLEIFKLSNPDNNLAGPNPISMTHSLTSWMSKLRRLVFTFGGINLIATSVTLLLTLVNIIVYQLNHLETRSGEENEASPWEEKSARSFSLAEMQFATNNFDDALVVGIGGFGKVYKGTIDHGAKTVAIKRLKLESKQGVQEFRMEIETLSTFLHIHLVSLIGYCDEGQEMLLVYEYMCRGTLADCLYKIRNRNGSASGSSPLSWEQRLRICIGAALGLDYLHSGRGPGHGLIHRDVKSSNILLDENWVAKISDFGLSKMDAANLSCTHFSTDVKGTFGYLDPEYFRTRRLTSKSDVYAFGVVLFEVLCGRPAVDRSLVEEEQHSLALWVMRCIKDRTIDQIVDTSVREQISSHGLKAFVEIAAKCLLDHSNERPMMAEVVRVLELELERQSSAYSDTEEENSNGQISSTSPTMEENMHNVDQNIAHGVKLSPKSTKTPRMKKDNASNRGSIWGWRWDSLWRRPKPSRVVTSPQPEVWYPWFSPSEIREMSRNFSRLIGNDPFSNVYFGYINDMRAVAFKRFENRIYEEFSNYISMEFELQHVNLVQFIGYSCYASEVVLVYEYIPNGCLYDHLHSNNSNYRLSWKQRLKICIDAAQGLNYLHTYTKHKIVHRNVSSRNILLDGRWVAKITNLRCSAMIPLIQSLTFISTAIVGTIGCIDEKYSSTGYLSEKCDVFSFGVVLFEVLSGRKALEPKEEEPYLYRWVKDREIDHIIDPYLIGNTSMASLGVYLEIARKCLCVREFERPSMLNVLNRLTLALSMQIRGHVNEEEGITELVDSHIYSSYEESSGGVLVDDNDIGGVLDDSDNGAFPR